MPAIPEVYLRNNDLVHVHEGRAAGTGTAVAGGGKGHREILVLGEVKRPGIYRFSGGERCTILHLIFKMGGLPPYANTKSIRIMRMDHDGYEIEHRLDARPVLKEGDPRDDFELLDGDRVVVPARRISLF
jgi:protein involved in polysaccharide export with SLBB domain